MRPYIICHMIQALDGRIDCDVMDRIDDSEHYYSTLASLECDATIEGCVTLRMHYARKISGGDPDLEAIKAEGNHSKAGTLFFKAKESSHWAVGVDTHGSLLWDDNVEAMFERPLIMILSETVPSYYLEYLKRKGISFITTPGGSIDLGYAMDVLSREFGIRRLAVVGGGHLNASFLSQGLIDEISMLLASGIDGRSGMTSSFDGLDKTKEPTRLALRSVQRLDELIWARYTIKE